MAVALLLSGFVPILVRMAAASGQITDRSLTISSAVPSATNVSYTFSFTLPSTAMVQSLKFRACTTAIGTYPGGSCTPPVGMTASGDGFDNAAFVSQSGWQPNGSSFAVDPSGANDCISGSSNPNILCANRTDATAQTATARTIVFNTIKNPSAPNTAFYVGVTTYTDSAWSAANITDAGTMASAVVQTLSTSASVAEILNFCVGATTVDNTTSLIAADCSAMGGTSLNLGTIDTSTVNISPWTTNGGDSQNGTAMVRSNAGNGTVIAYDAIQQSGTNHLGTLRISGASCSAASGPGTGSPPAVSGPFTDPCIDAAGGTQNTIASGQEEFGMTIAGINSGSTSSYSCTYGSPGNTCNLQPLTNYLGDGTTGGGEVYGTGNGFAWDESGTAVNIASSAGSTVKQVDDEALILKYAATPSITTPFGLYTAQTDLIAIPTY